MFNKRKVIAWLSKVSAVLALLFAFVFVGSLDYKDEQDQQSLFCDNVKKGIWPNYKGMDCGREKSERQHQEN